MAKRRSSSKPSSSAAKKPKVTSSAEAEEIPPIYDAVDEEIIKPEEQSPSPSPSPSPSSPARNVPRKTAKRDELDCRFLGEPIPADVAKSRWPHRYSKSRAKTLKPGTNEEEELTQAKFHYSQAEVDSRVVFHLNDHAHVSSEENADPYICKITELFEGVDGLPYFRAQWYYRPKDTVIKDAFTLRETKRIFPSDIQDDNPLDCLVEKINIVRVKPNLDILAKESAVPECDYYYDMKYLLPYSTFIIPPEEAVLAAGDSQSSISSEIDDMKTGNDEVNQVAGAQSPEMTLLDLYCGCGAMSTGLCLGANLGGINLVTKWAVDINKYACESLKLNHPETEVRNESVDDFLMLLKEWSKLCASYSLIKSDDTHKVVDAMGVDEGDDANDDDSEEEDSNDDEVFEVEQILGICYGDPKENQKAGLHFKVRWKGYGPDEDTWEPVDGLGNCRESIGVFVKNAFKNKALPLPGDVDMICGGPPCQGLSGFNRFRNKESPLSDPKNKQLVVYMDVVDYLKPKYLLMENVVDLLKFSQGYCGRYALGRLVDMNYQARMGMMAAGSYGLPQFRMRVFLWGARPSESLAQYPLPTHDVVYRGVVPVEFEMNTVAYTQGQDIQLENKLFLGDAISDLPAVENDESRDEMPYGGKPQTEFQRFIRLTKEGMIGIGSKLCTTLYDHRPLQLNVDDHQRVCRVPKRKGANFRDFPGVRVKPDNKVEWDPEVERVKLPSGKPLVPDYAMSFVGGTSTKPFGRLWYDETVPTVVTRAEPHNHALCHPFQDRVLTIRENARLQGFPDYYQLKGPIKERYIQVGNAVAVPVARALGYALALASQGSIDDKHLLKLPAGFPVIHADRATAPSVEVDDTN
ncbi:hypothetical protein vseg_008585 [Gypsophila vaccaria]